MPLVKRIEPSFMIIGTQKGGTTSLHNYLDQHPELTSPVTKELHYFDQTKLADIETYRRNFPRQFFKKKRSFESTPRYLYYPHSAERLFNYNPNLKFIVLLRNPVKRAFSAWNMYREMHDYQLTSQERIKGGEKERTKAASYFKSDEFPSFKEAIEVEFKIIREGTKEIEPSLIRRGYYEEQISNYIKYFKREQFLFIYSNDLKNKTMDVLGDISEFLSISNFNNLAINLDQKFNKRSYINHIDEELYNELLKHYQSKNKKLHELTGLQSELLYV